MSALAKTHLARPASVLPPLKIQTAFQALSEDVLHAARRHLIDCTVFPISTDILWSRLPGLDRWITDTLAQQPDGTTCMLEIRCGVLELCLRRPAP